MSIHDDFLGSWILDTSTCEYQQGDPPTSGQIDIHEDGDELVISMEWIDSEGAREQVSFRGVPDGKPASFPGGELVDALSIEAPNPRELTSRGFHDGKERMVAQRQLDSSKMAMRLTQLVRFEDGTSLANVSVYRRRVLN